MKNNDKFFRKAIKNVNIEIEKRSGVYFSFNSFKLKLAVNTYRIFYRFLNFFYDKDFHDAFIISCIFHLICILCMVIYTVASSKLYFYKANTKRENVMIFDLSNLKVDRQNKLPKIKPVNKVSTRVKNKTTLKNQKTFEKKSNTNNLSYNLKQSNGKSSTVNNEKDKIKNNKQDFNKSDKQVPDDLLLDVKKGIKAEGVEDINVPAGSDSSVNNQELQIAYIDAIKFRVQNCWNVDAGIKGIKNIVIKITVSLFKTGYVQNIDILNSADYNSPEFNVVADSAKRAIISCAPYKFADDRYDYWKNINFNFYPDKRSIE